MCKNCINYLNEKVCALISLIINLIFGILLVVWKNDRSKTATTNAIDKVVNSIFNIFVLLKDVFCHKKEANETAKPEKETSLIEKGRAFVKDIAEIKKTIVNLNKFVADNINSEDIKIKRKAEEAESLLIQIKKEAHKI